MNNIFYDDNLQQGAAEIPVIAISMRDGIKYEFPSLTCAAERLNITVSEISRCLNGEHFQSGDYHFRYADETYAEWRRRHRIIASPNRKPIIATNLEYGSEQFYPSVRTAAKELGVYGVYISRAIEGNTKCVPNYSFRYATEEDIC